MEAEDVARVASALAFTNEKGEVEGVKYEKLSLLLINAVKEQQALLEQQQAQLKAQRQELAVLKQAFCAARPQARPYPPRNRR